MTTAHDAIVYCQNIFSTTNGKTAHGLVRSTRRYNVLALVDASLAGQDAGEALDGVHRSIPCVADMAQAMAVANDAGRTPTHMVMGLTPDGGRLEKEHRQAVRQALEMGLNIDSGLHDFLGDDPEFAELARQNKVSITDVRKTPPRDTLHFFSGKIEEVDSLVIAVLGTDSALGKRTTTVLLAEALNKAGIRTSIVGTGQTSWMQGIEPVIILDSLINDFVSGEIEHAVWTAWKDQSPQVILVEGQGSLMNPAYPGGFEILAAARPDAIILQHAPGRMEYDGFPGYPIQPLHVQIRAIELLSAKPVTAVTINHENLTPEETGSMAREIEREIGLPAMDLLLDGTDTLVTHIRGLLEIRGHA